MSEDAEEAFPEAPEREQMLQMVAQQLVGAMQALADWWELHPDVPRERILQVAMDFVWVGQDRLSQGKRWSS